ncbi:MAG: hypothetical protein JWO52_5159 [Gammaproteobacteria bacterium]|jgi:hypothetical protein|nr:hypothetical protein [Gammaproteobacteria bacterium]
MKRSVRRYQQRVTNARRARILLRHGAWAASGHWEPKIWQPLCRVVMNEPGWWVHDRVVVPARTEARRLEHEVKRGRDPDSLLWPDCKRPHDYYW